MVVGGFFLLSSNKNSTTVVQETPKIVEQETDDDTNSVLKEITITLNPDETNVDVSQSGTATLEETATGLSVVVMVTGYESELGQPAHIHAGVCPEVGAVVYPLEILVDGTSTTLLEGMKLEDLAAQLPLALNVHKSADEASIYTSCGNLELDLDL